ncbi:MAG: hypothetical protein ACTHZ5_14440 [Micrococcaceae bacterium]
MIVGLQAIGLVISAIMVLSLLGEGALGLPAQLFLVFLILLGAVWLGAAAWGVKAGKTWTRAAVIVIELFAVILSIGSFSAGDIRGGLVLLLPAAAVLLLLFTPSVNTHLGQRYIDR